jgi:hypothetical protein
MVNSIDNHYIIIKEISFLTDCMPKIEVIILIAGSIIIIISHFHSITVITLHCLNIDNCYFNNYFNPNIVITKANKSTFINHCLPFPLFMIHK